MTRPFAFSHVTAAHILGWDAPWASEVTGDIHVLVATDGGPLRRDGIVGHRGFESRTRIRRYGLPVVAPGDTWVDLGEMVGLSRPYSFDHIVMGGDQALNSGMTVAQLRDLIGERVRPRGKRTLSAALPWVRAGAESGYETLARLCLLRASLPEPVLNKNVYDPAGRFIFRPDLSWPEKRLAVEYQGAEFHDHPEAVAAFGRRVRRAEAHEWTIIELRRQDIWEKPARDAALRRIADALSFPAHRLRLSEAAPQWYSPEAAQTLLENLERRRRRGYAVGLAS